MFRFDLFGANAQLKLITLQSRYDELSKKYADKLCESALLAQKLTASHYRIDELEAKQVDLEVELNDALQLVGDHKHKAIDTLNFVRDEVVRIIDNTQIVIAAETLDSDKVEGHITGDCVTGKCSF